MRVAFIDDDPNELKILHTYFNDLTDPSTNTFSGSLDIDQERHFVSSKHEGLGLGTESIKSIAEKYGGVCQFEANNGMFYASVMCFKDHV